MYTPPLNIYFFLSQQVQLIVQRALKLYSEDRTGQVDYALESGGKQTYRTHTQNITDPFMSF